MILSFLSVESTESYCIALCRSKHYLCENKGHNPVLGLEIQPQVLKFWAASTAKG